MIILRSQVVAIGLLVVGGYSRSRLRKLVVGGVTGYRLAKADIPVFMVD